MEVVLINVTLDAGDQLTHALKRSAANGLLGDQAEPALDLIEPARVCRREVHVIASTFGQPCSDLRMLVGRIVVDDEMRVKVCRHRTVNVIEEGDEFLMPMARLALSDDPPVAALRAANNVVVPWRT